MLTEQCRDRCQCCEPSGGVVEGMGRQRPRLIDPRGSTIRGQTDRPHKLIDDLTDWGGKLTRHQASSVQTADHIAFAVQWEVGQPPPDCDYLGGKGASSGCDARVVSMCIASKAAGIGGLLGCGSCAG